jgi:hypothetical protein
MSRLLVSVASSSPRSDGEETGYRVAGLADAHFVEESRVIRCLRADIDGARAPAHGGDEPRRGVDGAAAADGDEDVARAERALDRV